MSKYQENEFLVKLYKINNLVNGNKWVLNNETYEKLCVNAREKVLKEFDSKLVPQKYIELYKEMLNG